MAVALKNLKKAYWTKLKDDAGIAKAPWYKKADAAVGPAIAKLEKARARWKGEKSFDTYLGYFNALEALDDAFSKFVKKKDVDSSAEKKDVAKEINDWRDEIASKLDRLKTKYPISKLEALNKQAMGDRAADIFEKLNVE